MKEKSKSMEISDALDSTVEARIVEITPCDDVPKFLKGFREARAQTGKVSSQYDVSCAI